MRTYKGKPPEVEVHISRKNIDNPEIRGIAIHNELRDYVERKDWRFRKVGFCNYREHTLETKDDRGIPYEVVPVLNLGYLESRTIEESTQQECDFATGYTRITGIVNSEAVREDVNCKLTRITYEVLSTYGEHGQYLKQYVITDTYVEGGVKEPEFTFVSKLI